MISIKNIPLQLRQIADFGCQNHHHHMLQGIDGGGLFLHVYTHIHEGIISHFILYGLFLLRMSKIQKPLHSLTLSLSSVLVHYYYSLFCVKKKGVFHLYTHAIVLLLIIVSNNSNWTLSAHTQSLVVDVELSSLSLSPIICA